MPRSQLHPEQVVQARPHPKHVCAVQTRREPVHPPHRHRQAEGAVPPPHRPTSPAASPTHSTGTRTRSTSEAPDPEPKCIIERHDDSVPAGESAEPLPQEGEGLARQAEPLLERSAPPRPVSPAGVRRVLHRRGQPQADPPYPPRRTSSRTSPTPPRSRTSSPRDDAHRQPRSQQPPRHPPAPAQQVCTQVPRRRTPSSSSRCTSPTSRISPAAPSAEIDKNDHCIGSAAPSAPEPRGIFEHKRVPRRASPAARQQPHHGTPQPAVGVVVARSPPRLLRRHDKSWLRDLMHRI